MPREFGVVAAIASFGSPSRAAARDGWGGASPAASSADVAPDPAAGDPELRVELEDIWHRYGPGGGWTLRELSLQLRRGELIGLLGPSGCGKTTLLRLIAGFETPASGCVRIDGRAVAAPGRLLPPERRGVGMVFQDYALFPHLDAWENARFGLHRGQDPERVRWLLDLLGLRGLERRYPHELSGGQRQRLALARALAPEPAVVLLDEPFSNLDVEVRQRLRSELPAVLAQCGASALLVTHDPQEALAICDRVAVLQEGVLQQCAAPETLVHRPANAFVGGFVLQANLLPVERQGDRLHCVLGEITLPRPLPRSTAPDPESSEPLRLLLRASDLSLEPEGSAAEPAGVRAHVVAREFLGSGWLYHLHLESQQLGSQRLQVSQPLGLRLEREARCRVRLAVGAAPLLFPGALPVGLNRGARPFPVLP